MNANLQFQPFYTFIKELELLYSYWIQELSPMTSTRQTFYSLCLIFNQTPKMHANKYIYSQTYLHLYGVQSYSGHPRTSLFFLFSASSHSMSGWKYSIRGWTDIFGWPVIRVMASGQGLLEPNFITSLRDRSENSDTAHSLLCVHVQNRERERESLTPAVSRLLWTGRCHSCGGDLTDRRLHTEPCGTGTG